MKLFKIWQSVNQKRWDVYEEAVVCALNKEDAKMIHPSGRDMDWDDDDEDEHGNWVSNPSYVHVEYLGEAQDNLERGVIVASFHAG